VSRMNGPTRKRFYDLLAKQDGEYCRCCGKLSSEGQLVIDHRNNNNSDNNLENLQLLCRHCNYLKNPRQPVDLCVSESIIDGTVSEIDTNRRKEPLFRKFTVHLIHDHTEVPEHDIINSGSEEIGISPVTAKRYLDKLCSGRGLLERVNRVNTIMIRYKDVPPGI